MLLQAATIWNSIFGVELELDNQAQRDADSSGIDKNRLFPNCMNKLLLI